ncbi:MAG: hypothetical protein JW947_04470 [Sedimentisphaerales bacterium]|nr:hypothetical protein [Sedimentisphaerales bacterium]
MKVETDSILPKIAKKTPSKLTSLDVILRIGIALLVFGVISGWLFQFLYNEGTPGLLVEYKYHKYNVPEIPRRDHLFKAVSDMSTILAVAGLVLAASALITKFTIKRVKISEEEKVNSK